MHRYTLSNILFLWLLGSLCVCAKPKNSIPDSLQVLRFEVNGERFSMQRVESGVFIMGGTREQHREPISTDFPTHTVALDAYYIAHTEVTQALWRAVMSEWEFVEELYMPNAPMSYVNWYDCLEFIQRLDSITGMPFRLPTEAEWEFAARGGNQCKSSRYAGSNDIDVVSWSSHNAGFRKHTVAQKHPNELCLYDMTGNVSEWCSDWYAPYYLGTPPNPQGAASGQWKVVRGASFDNCKENSYLSRREYLDPKQATNYCGLRLALTLPNEPTLLPHEEPEVVKRIKIGGVRLKMLYMPVDTPFYIAEEAVTWRIWSKIMGEEAEGKFSHAVIGKTQPQWQRMLEQCRQKSKTPLEWATEQEVTQAIKAGVIAEPTTPTHKVRRWEKDIQSIQRRRRTISKAQKWADLIGMRLTQPDDPILEIYAHTQKNQQPQWLVVRCK